MTEAIKDLFRMVARVNEIATRHADIIAHHKRNRILAANSVDVSPYSGGKEMQDIAREIKRRLIVEISEAADRECREMELSMAGELETLRAILPSIAAKAAIEAGTIARQMTNKEPTA